MQRLLLRYLIPSPESAKEHEPAASPRSGRVERPAPPMRGRPRFFYSEEGPA